MNSKTKWNIIFILENFLHITAFSMITTLGYKETQCIPILQAYDKQLFQPIFHVYFAIAFVLCLPSIMVLLDIPIYINILFMKILDAF